MGLYGRAEVGAVLASLSSHRSVCRTLASTPKLMLLLHLLVEGGILGPTLLSLSFPLFFPLYVYLPSMDLKLDWPFPFRFPLPLS